ncbi:MAG: hypothetical protein OWU84_08070 [Firmicutes bacterium]|nr:hypothetical protein [Bacillota bacterium]
MTMLDLLQPVSLAQVHRSDPLLAHPAVDTRCLPKLPFTPPWPWYPSELPHVGIAASGETPRAWFAGIPQGLEWQAFLDTVVAVGRGRRLAISALAAETLATCSLSVTMAVLTTPG